MKRPAVLACLGAMLTAAALASTPTAWEMNSYRDFSAGRLTGLSLTRDGRLTLAPKIETLLASDQPVIWSVATAPDGVIYAGTGHHGRVFRIDKSGKSSLYWTADQPEIFAIAVDAKGVLYAATSPDGAIYRIENGKATEYFSPKTKYIWALAFGPDGVLYAGTGDQGTIFRIGPDGKGDVYYETGQAHVTCLALDKQGRLLAGSEPNGLIYRVTEKDKAFVLYDSTLPEVRALVPGPDGTIYAAALGGSMDRRALGGVTSGQGVPSSASVSTTSATVTVEASADDSGIDIKPKPDAAKPQSAQPAAAGAVVSPAAGVVDLSGMDKSAIYRINPDNTVETLWISKEENAYDMLVSGGQIVFSTDGKGRIYRPVHDANTVARWGRLNWRGELPAGSQVVFRTRSGNSVRPDKTWSDWSDPLTDPNGSPVKSPNARYIQWKAEVTGSASAQPALENVTIAYLPQNTPPGDPSASRTSE